MTIHESIIESKAAVELKKYELEQAIEKLQMEEAALEKINPQLEILDSICTELGNRPDVDHSTVIAMIENLRNLMIA